MHLRNMTSACVFALLSGAAAADECRHVAPGETVTLRGSATKTLMALDESRKVGATSLHFSPTVCLGDMSEPASDAYLMTLMVSPGKLRPIAVGKESDFTGAFVTPPSTSLFRVRYVFRVDGQRVVPPPPPTIEDAKRYIAQKIANDRACVRDQDAVMANEREVGRVSGVVNMQTLHQAGETKLYCQRELDKALVACRQSRTCP